MSRESSSTLRDGLLLGSLAFLTVAFFYAAFDFLAARGPLFTVDLLGKALFRGLRDPAVLNLPVEPDTTAVVLYTALHLAASLAIGLVVAWLLDVVGRGGSAAWLARGAVVVGFAVTVTVAWAMTVPLRPLLPQWSIVAANALAVVVAGSVFAARRPGAVRRFVGIGTPRTGAAA